MTFDHTIDEATTRRVVDLIDGFDTSDPEAVHAVIDGILLDLVPDPISEAVQRAISRCDWWATA